MAFRSQVSSFVQPIPDVLWQIHPMNQLAWLKYFKDLKPDHSFLSWLVTYFNPNTLVFRFEDSEHDLAEIAALCPVYLPDGINLDQALPLEPFLSRVLSMDVDPSWIRACCFLLLYMYAMKNRQPGIGDFRLLTVVRDMQMYHRTVLMMIMGETMWWGRDISLHVTNFNVHHRGCPMLLQACALDKLSLIPPVSARLIPTYGPVNFRPRSQGHFDFGDNPVISLDRFIAYFLDRINRQYGMMQRVPRIHDFKSGPMTQSLLTNLADRWQNQNTWYLGQGVMQDTVTPEYVTGFTPNDDTGF
ncbi:hypothetical protein JCGZ_19446 [Jatropha curcas]|uniref:Aminotransferase-like plant mobile domain-containing protein n=1 Tax=Jatropha curcas TaxID=180498 RepID=A0A067K2N2_JATCU|nr:hypothetical protein JCGZ_19446 [Jatropha curcas]